MNTQKDIKLILTVDEAIIVKDIFSRYISMISSTSSYLKCKDDIENFLNFLKRIEDSLNQELKIRDGIEELI